MKRTTVISILAAVILIAAIAWTSGSIRGATAAVIDNARGRPAFYSLGCTSEWPREPRDFRVYELLARDYHMAFITIGGIGPSPFQSKFADAYDAVSYRLLELRYGPHFDAEVRRRAAADVFEHHVVLEGCYWGSPELVMANRDVIGISGPPEVMQNLAALAKKTVRLQGTMTDIRGSSWRSVGRPQTHVAQVQLLGEPCGYR
jgi:hypothetical protein